MKSLLLRRILRPVLWGLLAACLAVPSAATPGHRPAFGLPGEQAGHLHSGSVELPVLLASESSAFDRACENYYRQGNDPEVPDFAAFNFCECLAGQYAEAGLGFDALEFFARTYSDDLTTFIHEYPDGDAWMEQSFQADVMCKSG